MFSTMKNSSLHSVLHSLLASERFDRDPCSPFRLCRYAPVTPLCVFAFSARCRPARFSRWLFTLPALHIATLSCTLSFALCTCTTHGWFACTSASSLVCSRLRFAFSAVVARCTPLCNTRRLAVRSAFCSLWPPVFCHGAKEMADQEVLEACSTWTPCCGPRFRSTPWPSPSGSSQACETKGPSAPSCLSGGTSAGPSGF